MNFLDRQENRAKFERTPENTEQATEGSVLAKHIIGITEADRAERRMGRFKWASRLGAIGLLSTKASMYMNETISRSFDFIQDRELNHLDGRWFTPAVVGLYGLSRAFRRRQNVDHVIAESRREVFDKEYGHASDYGDFATGDINTMGQFHYTRTPIGDLNASDSPMQIANEFLHEIEPTIPMADRPFVPKIRPSALVQHVTE